MGHPEQGVPAGAVGAGPEPATDSAGEREPAVSDARQHGKKRVPHSGTQRQQQCIDKVFTFYFKLKCLIILIFLFKKKHTSYIRFSILF